MAHQPAEPGVVRPRPATIKEVARLAGVSPMTASRTLGGGTYVRPELQQRVQDAALRLGYHRNENARSIRPGQRSGLIGVAITNLGNPYYGTFALGLEEVAAQHGRRIILGNTGEDPQRERQLIADFVGRQVEGLVLVPSGRGSPELRSEALRGTPLVLASRLIRGLPTDAVLVDDAGGAYRGTTALIEHGHERIGFLGNAQSVFTGRRRFRGFARALADRGLSVDPTLVRRGQQDVETAASAMESLLDLPEPPTAVFSANNRNTIGALTAIGRRLDGGQSAATLPALTSFDSFELAELMPVPVTIVDHDPRELGRQAGRMLFERLSGACADKPRRREIPTTLRIARS